MCKLWALSLLFLLGKLTLAGIFSTNAPPLSSNVSAEMLEGLSQSRRGGLTSWTLRRAAALATVCGTRAHWA